MRSHSSTSPEQTPFIQGSPPAYSTISSSSPSYASSPPDERRGRPYNYFRAHHHFHRTQSSTSRTRFTGPPEEEVEDDNWSGRSLTNAAIGIPVRIEREEIMEWAEDYKRDSDTECGFGFGACMCVATVALVLLGTTLLQKLIEYKPSQVGGKWSDVVGPADGVWVMLLVVTAMDWLCVVGLVGAGAMIAVLNSTREGLDEGEERV